MDRTERLLDLVALLLGASEPVPFAELRRVFPDAYGGASREAAEQRFVLIQAYAPSLALYPESEWAAVEERLRELMAHQPDARLYVLSVMSNAVEVTPDGQGRILIPARLKEAAGLEGQVLLVGAIDKVEIWNPKRFEAEVNAGSAGFDRFAPQIFR